MNVAGFGSGVRRVPGFSCTLERIRSGHSHPLEKVALEGGNPQVLSDAYRLRRSIIDTIQKASELALLTGSGGLYRKISRIRQILDIGPP